MEDPQGGHDSVALCPETGLEGDGLQPAAHCPGVEGSSAAPSLGAL